MPDHTDSSPSNKTNRRPQPPTYTEPRGLLAGKTAIITAAAGTGIGAAAARRFLEEGATVVISDLHERRLGETVDSLESLTGKRPFATLCDVTKQSDVDNLIAFARNMFHGIDILVNNAGLGGTADLVEMTDEQWHRVLDVTLTATMRVTRAVLPLMYAAGRGAIVNNASVLGWRAQKEQAHYAAAKAGVMALTRCAAVEGAEIGVRINAVAPSLAVHPMLKKSAPEELLKELEGKEAYGRGAEVWEVANVMMFLASDYSSYMTGEILAVSAQRA